MQPELIGLDGQGKLQSGAWRPEDADGQEAVVLIRCGMSAVGITQLSTSASTILG